MGQIWKLFEFNLIALIYQDDDLIQWTFNTFIGAFDLSTNFSALPNKYQTHNKKYTYVGSPPKILKLGHLVTVFMVIHLNSVILCSYL